MIAGPPLKRTRMSSGKNGVVELAGQLSTCTHILHTDPACILMELCTTDGIHRIICEQLELNLCDLVIGQYYKFSNLERVNLKVTSGAVKCFRFSLTTKWIRCKEVVNVQEPPNLKGLVTLKGVVSEVNDELGICYLANSVMVIISTSSRVAMTPMPKKGQVISIFNAHRIPVRDNKIAYALCVKSHLRIEDQEVSEFPPINLSPVLVSLGDQLRDYRAILWLLDCSKFLKTNFSDHFLSSFGLPMSELNDFRSELLKKIAEITLQKSNWQRKSILEEFFSPAHNISCGTLKEEMFPVSLLNLLDLSALYPALEVDQANSGSGFHWQYDVKKDQETLLIVVISVENTNHRLSLHDSHVSIPSLVIPEKGTTLSGEDLAALNRKFVLVWRHDVFREKFTWLKEGEECSTKLKFLGIFPNKFQVLSMLSREWKEPNSSKNHLVLSSQRHIEDDMGNKIDCATTSIACCSKQVNVPKAPIYKNVDLHSTGQYLSQYIHVQIKTSIFFPPMHGKQPKFYLLVLLCGETVPVESRNSPARKDYQTNRACFIAFENSLLNLHPLISVDSTYEIRLPMSCGSNFFKNRSAVTWAHGMRAMIPCTTGVILPACCEIHLVEQCSFPTSNLKLQDCYGIEQCLQMASTSELVNIVGYILERHHQEPRYDRENINVNSSGFGIPGSKIIALSLSDTYPGVETGTQAAIYLSYWSTIQYPLALVPGTRIIFRSVVKVNPKPGCTATSPYFRSSILSSVEIGSRKDPRSLLSLILREEGGKCGWLTVSMHHLISLSGSVFCSACKHPFQNDQCSFVGCSAEPNPTFLSQACFKISESETLALVFVPVKMVIRLFSSAERLWGRILRLSQCFGRLE